MNDPVDFDRLNEMTGGLSAVQAELFLLYRQGSDGCLRKMRGCLDGKYSELWRRQAHTWKGMSLNLGASRLADLCGQALYLAEAGCGEKKALLAEIEAEYERVKAWFKGED